MDGTASCGRGALVTAAGAGTVRASLTLDTSSLRPGSGDRSAAGADFPDDHPR
jgi:hypothetical protein